MPRPNPFDLVFGHMDQTRFPALDQALVSGGFDPRDLNGFTYIREGAELLKEFRPEEGLGTGIDDFVAFVHAAFLYWRDGKRIVTIDRDTLDRLVSGTVADPVADAGTYYVQLPIQRVWGEPFPDGGPEPLDGGFVQVRPGRLEVVGIFGLRPGREGFTVAQTAGPRPSNLSRADGTPLFAPRFGDARAVGLYSLTGAEELLELCYRCHLEAGLKLALAR
jgi:hypothetical protein